MHLQNFAVFQKPNRNSPFTNVKDIEANEHVIFFFAFVSIYVSSVWNTGYLLLTRSSLPHKEFKGKLISGVPRLTVLIHVNPNFCEIISLKYIISYTTYHKYFHLVLEG